MRNYIRTIAGDILHLIAPSLCPGCDEPTSSIQRGICEACRTSLETAPYPEEMYQDLLEKFSPEELALDAIGSLYNYEKEGPVQHIIHAIKYRGCRALGRSLGEELGRTMQVFPEFKGIDLVVPVPLHRARQRERGYNQAEEIAYGVGKVWGAQLLTDILVRKQHTTSQTHLSATARRGNVLDAFVTTGNDLRGASVLLCDDVFTTGATLNACALQLCLAGAQSVSGLTLARDERESTQQNTFSFNDINR